MSRKHGPTGLRSQVTSEVAYGDVIGHWSLVIGGIFGALCRLSLVGSRQSTVGSDVSHWRQGFSPACGTEVPPPGSRKHCRATPTKIPSYSLLVTRFSIISHFSFLISYFFHKENR